MYATLVEDKIPLLKPSGSCWWQDWGSDGAADGPILPNYQIFLLMSSLRDAIPWQNDFFWKIIRFDKGCFPLAWDEPFVGYYWRSRTAKLEISVSQKYTFEKENIGFLQGFFSSSQKCISSTKQNQPKGWTCGAVSNRSHYWIISKISSLKFLKKRARPSCLHWGHLWGPPMIQHKDLQKSQVLSS